MRRPVTVYKLRSRLAGGHIHQQVFTGYDRDHLALAGELVFDLGEWQLFGALLALGADRIEGHALVLLEDDEALQAALQGSDFPFAVPVRPPEPASEEERRRDRDA